MSKQSYSKGIKSIHLVNAVVYIVDLLIGYLCAWVLVAETDSRFLAMNLHKSFGLLVLLIAIVWIIWRYFSLAPDHSKELKPWELKSSKAAQVLLLLSMFLLPISGVLFQSYKGLPADFFWWFNVALPVEKSESLALIFLDIHKFTGYFITVVLGIHIVAAFKHYFIDKDNILQSMWKWK